MRYLLVFLLTGLVFARCKKDKLEGEASRLEGTWTWTSSWGEKFSSPEECGCTRTLIFKTKGKYELWEDGKRIEAGRITYENATDGKGGEFFKVDFRRNYPLSKSEHFYGTCALSVSDNTLSIGERLHFTDQPSHIYVR